jgi:hypothetical protein
MPFVSQRAKLNLSVEEIEKLVLLQNLRVNCVDIQPPHTGRFLRHDHENG